MNSARNPGCSIVSQLIATVTPVCTRKLGPLIVTSLANAGNALVSVIVRDHLGNAQVIVSPPPPTVTCVMT
jgi:hypothetical protein